MNIGMLLDNPFYGDLRVENEVQALTKAGYKVFVYCFSFDGNLYTDDYFGATIVRMPVSKKKVFRLRGLTNTFLNYYPYFLSNLITKYILKNKIDVLHIHDLYLFETGLIIKKKFSKLVLVGDLHENYVEGLKHYKFANTFPGKYLISIKKWEKKEIEWCKKFDFLITVIEEAVDRYSSLGIPKEKFSVVSNYVNLQTFNRDNIEQSIIDKFKNFKTIIYVGGFDFHRGLESLIRAVPKIKKNIKDFKLILVGSGRNINDLVALSKKLNVENSIIFEGWRDHKLLPSYIEAADICIIPHLKTNHTDNTIPHKLFQYMFLRKPIISSNCNPIKRILDETNAGSIYISNNENDLAEKAIELLSDKNKQKLFGENGYTAVMNKYNWNETSKKLIHLYDSLKKRLNG